MPRTAHPHASPSYTPPAWTRDPRAPSAVPGLTKEAMIRASATGALAQLAAAAAAAACGSGAPQCSTSGAAAAAAPVALAALVRSYHKNVVDHYERPRNVGSFDKNDPNVGTGLVGAPACGDVM